MKTELIRCDSSHLDMMQELSKKTYRSAFLEFTTEEIMERYLDDAFSIDKLKQELENPASIFYLLYADDVAVGYLKLNYYKAQKFMSDPSSIEIERIYLTKEMQGKGLGHLLMNKAVEEAIENEGIEYIWLGVWEKNQRAIEFYEKNGYEIVGRKTFMMAEDEQYDYVMRKDLY